MDKNNQNAIKETLLLLNQGIDKQIKERKNDEEEDFTQIWESLQEIIYEYRYLYTIMYKYQKS